MFQLISVAVENSIYGSYLGFKNTKFLRLRRGLFLGTLRPQCGARHARVFETVCLWVWNLHDLLEILLKFI